jgi:16S rRNA (cytosine1402-N4)-methyltransferase
MTHYHRSVMVEEVLEYLAIRAHGVYVDVTFGGGGHTRAILEREPTCRVIACDWDNDALILNGERLEQEFPGRVTLLWTNFSRLAEKLHKLGIVHVDGILADFGTSRYQIETKAGFSFARETPLDMRMSAAHHKVTAYDILHNSSEAELVHIIGVYGGERHAKRIAHAIVTARTQKKPLRTTLDLAQLIETVVPEKHTPLHPATRTFQALRIVVNKELENIHAFLKKAPDLIEPGGRCVCISFHSGEDSMVKRSFHDHPEVWNVVTRHVVIPSQEEIDNNAASRSAKLRCAERR